MMINCLFALLCFFGWSHCHADENTEKAEFSDLVILPADAVVAGDYFAFGDSIEISGTVKGDLYVAGGQVFIDGKVEGDVVAAAGSMDISGEVMQNIRAIAGQIHLSGYVGHNIALAAGNAQIAPSAVIEGNLVCGAGNVDLSGKLGSNVSIAASNLRISSHISKNLRCYVSDMRLTSKARIGGNFEYRSNSLAYIDSKAVIEGLIIRHPSLFEDLFKGTFLRGLLLGSKVAVTLMNFLYSLAIGLILIKIFPKRLESALASLKQKPWSSFAVGLLLLVLLPLASLILLMTVLGVPFALTLIALNIIGFYTAKVFTIFWASDAVLSRFTLLKKNKGLSFTIVLVFYFALTAIPFFGFILSFFCMLIGLGAGVLGQRDQIFAKK